MCGNTVANVAVAIMATYLGTVDVEHLELRQRACQRRRHECGEPPVAERVAWVGRRRSEAGQHQCGPIRGSGPSSCE